MLLMRSQDEAISGARQSESVVVVPQGA
jgi:hypothetical protein